MHKTHCSKPLLFAFFFFLSRVSGGFHAYSRLLVPYASVLFSRTRVFILSLLALLSVRPWLLNTPPPETAGPRPPKIAVCLLFLVDRTRVDTDGASRGGLNRFFP